MAQRFSTRPRTNRFARRRRASRRPMTRRRRVTRRRPTRQRSRRNLLNITSTKKRDNMQPVAISDDHTSDSVGPVTMSGDNLYGFLFSPSARRAKFTASQFNRNATNTFCRGYKETIEFESNGGSSWLWRRVCFLTKDDNLQLSFPSSTVDFESSQEGQMRALWNFQSGTTDANNALNALRDVIFAGTEGLDYTNLFSAALNPRKITVVSDRLRTLNGNSGHPHFFTHKNWWPINKSIVYKDKEEGGSDTDFKEVDPWSTMGKPGAGNLFVMDLFANAGANSDTEMTYHPHGTYYWHER